MARFAIDKTYPWQVSVWLPAGSKGKARSSRGFSKSRQVVEFSLRDVGVHLGQQQVQFSAS